MSGGTPGNGRGRGKRGSARRCLCEECRWDIIGAASGWEVRLPLESLGQQVMIIYIDIYGNDYREIKTPADFRGG